MAKLAHETALLREDIRRFEEERLRRLVCVECGRYSTGDARGWSA
jgi:hypothetical protein